MRRRPISYQLVIRIARSKNITVGRLGRLQFPAGDYVNTGSARRNMEARIRRHLSRTKRLCWHIDHLLADPAVPDRGRPPIRPCGVLVESAHAGADRLPRVRGIGLPGRMWRAFEEAVGAPMRCDQLVASKARVARRDYR